MANIKTTPEEWSKAREYFEAGLSLSEIVDKTGISKSQLSKKSNAEGWLKGNEKKQLIDDAVRVQAAKATLTKQAIDVHNEIVDERLRYLSFFDKAGLIISNAAVSRVQAEPDMPMADMRHASEIVAKQRDSVLGKAPDNQTNVQINNALPAVSVTFGD